MHHPRFNIQDAIPEKPLISWLIHPLSLTEKLKECTGEADLHVLEQKWTQAGWWETCFLNGLDFNTNVLHREILMFSNSTVCWYARTIVPEFSYENNRTFFSRLKQESLGVIVFNDPNVTRKRFFYYPINKQCLEFYWPSAHYQHHQPFLWARFSEFAIIQSDPFYLIEILLPDLLRVSR